MQSNVTLRWMRPGIRFSAKSARLVESRDEREWLNVTFFAKYVAAEDD
jgi:hypothetical protein